MAFALAIKWYALAKAVAHDIVGVTVETELPVDQCVGAIELILGGAGASWTVTGHGATGEVKIRYTQTEASTPRTLDPSYVQVRTVTVCASCAGSRVVARWAEGTPFLIAGVVVAVVAAALTAIAVGQLGALAGRGSEESPMGWLLIATGAVFAIAMLWFLPSVANVRRSVGLTGEELRARLEGNAG